MRSDLAPRALPLSGELTEEEVDAIVDRHLHSTNRTDETDRADRIVDQQLANSGYHRPKPEADR